MKYEKIITILGVSILILYCIIQILNFYGIGINIYGSYVGFYIFLLLSIFILPTSYSQLIK
jgi:hypothetical protein